MSDHQKYVNAYVDNALGMIHEQTSTILQLKSQLRIATEVVSEKDALISSLEEQLEETKKTASGLTKSVEDSNALKASYEALKNKVSHMDALTTQLNDIKHSLLNKNVEIENLTVLLAEKQDEIDSLKDPKSPSKKTINKKKVTEVAVAPVVPLMEVTPIEDLKLVEAQPKDENDDF
jgi:chromosome segregation ATPase